MGDRLLEQVLRGGNGTAANELLSEFFGGYPLHKLRLLLRSRNASAVKTGAFIASELGVQFAPLLDEVQRLLDHAIPDVRFDAVDVVLANEATVQSEVIANVSLFVQDSDKGVRWKALRFLTRVQSRRLEEAVSYIRDASVASMVQWLVESETGGVDARDFSARLSSPDPLIRAFAGIAAARVGTTGNLALLREVADSDDPEVGSFAKDELRLLEMRRQR